MWRKGNLSSSSFIPSGSKTHRNMSRMNEELSCMSLMIENYSPSFIFILSETRSKGCKVSSSLFFSSPWGRKAWWRRWALSARRHKKGRKITINRPWMIWHDHPKQESFRRSIPPKENYQWKIECFLEDLFLGGQSSIILGYRRLSVKFLPETVSPLSFCPLLPYGLTLQVSTYQSKYSAVPLCT